MVLLFQLCTVIVFISLSRAYLTGDSCRDFRGNFALRWTRCETCSPQRCQCRLRGGRLQADCERVAAVPQRVPFGCHLGATIQNSTHITCCPITCPPGGGLGLEETCETSFGGSFREGDNWTKCGTGATCCFHSCQCVREGGLLVERCQEACPRILLRPGCRIVQPFQNSTHHDCCLTECSAEQQCTSNVGDMYNVGDTWDECLPGDSCCQKRCTCTRRGDVVEPVCLRLCAKIAVPHGCRVVKSALRPINGWCCRAECPGSETCVSSFGVDFREGNSWEECSPGRSCCFKSCECTRLEGRLQKDCVEACPSLLLNPGCQIIEPVQNATHQDCCRTQCP